MKIQIVSFALFFLVAFAKGQESSGNIWDMLINDGNSNKIDEPIVFENIPSPTYVTYGPPAPVPVASASNVGVSLAAGGTFSPSGVIATKVEILKLVESFVKFKGEVVSRLYAVVVENWDLIRYLTNGVISRLGTLQAFTVNGIIILRKILEFAYYLFGSWKITVPNVSLDFSTLLKESDFYNINKK